MFSSSLKRAIAATAAALLLTASYVIAQDNQPGLKITHPTNADKSYTRSTATIELDRDAAFQRMHGEVRFTAQAQRESQVRRQRAAGHEEVNAFARKSQVPSAPALQSFGTGGGDRDEIEPNDTMAQGVSLPVNLFGEISFNGDVDYFAFDALAGQQVTIEAFATRLSRSSLIADIALFSANGTLLAASLGSSAQDPVIRYTPLSDQVLIVGITDADDLGGNRFDYLLNIARGLDVDEVEPNGTTAQLLPQAPATVFGEISGASDVDFYSFTATAGQTLIVDVDAEVLGSRLDAEVNLTDPQSGAEFFFNDQNDGDDPRFNIVLPYTGLYVIGIGAFNSGSTGFYRLNASLVSGTGAPIITQITRVSKKLIEVKGTGFVAGASVNVNGVDRRTTFVDNGTLRAKVKARSGDSVTVANLPDGRRSNPLIVQ
ncbi:MAG TPA: PPC domain-containing protein [Blastocatellia bacterium]|nr:PPC domain-containing protein [Blastocatellia bacterium]